MQDRKEVHFFLGAYGITRKAARTSHGLSSLHFTLFASFDPWRSSLGLSVTRHPSSSRRGEDRRAFGL